MYGKSPPVRGRGLKQVNSVGHSLSLTSPPVRGRGLKHVTARRAASPQAVAPRAGRGLKPDQVTPREIRIGKSPPVRGRGLKPLDHGGEPFPPLSPPVRGRGLKRARRSWRARMPQVAPRAGARIETADRTRASMDLLKSPPVRGRGLKLTFNPGGGVVSWSPPVRGRGLKHGNQETAMSPTLVAPRAGARIETRHVGNAALAASRPPCGGAD